MEYLFLLVTSWLITPLKALVSIVMLLGFAVVNTWYERKVSALMQDRIGANRASIFGLDLAGLVNTIVADPVKAIFKEDFVPKGTSLFLHNLAPFLATVPVLICFAAIPFGPPLVYDGVSYALQVANLNVGVLFILAMGSLAVYGCALAGWVSNNKFSMLGALRASAQMISYEVTLGISLVGLLAIYGTLDLNEITAFQGGTILRGALPAWGIFLNPVGCLLFFIALMAETKRAPFDLPESESDLVAGYFTEYSGMKFLLFWLGEFSEVAVLAAVVTVLFLGGWQVPYFDITTLSFAPHIGALVFFAKLSLLCLLQIMIRWTLPRFRFDQVMSLCWKYMLPISIANLVVTIFILLVQKEGLPW